MSSRSSHSTRLTAYHSADHAALERVCFWDPARPEWPLGHSTGTRGAVNRCMSRWKAHFNCQCPPIHILDTKPPGPVAAAPVLFLLSSVPGRRLGLKICGRPQKSTDLSGSEFERFRLLAK